MYGFGAYGFGVQEFGAYEYMVNRFGVYGFKRWVLGLTSYEWTSSEFTDIKVLVLCFQINRIGDVFNSNLTWSLKLTYQLLKQLYILSRYEKYS